MSFCHFFPLFKDGRVQRPPPLFDLHIKTYKAFYFVIKSFLCYTCFLLWKEVKKKNKKMIDETEKIKMRIAILGLIEKHKDCDYIDIAKQLNINLDYVIAILKELKEEGTIEEGYYVTKKLVLKKKKTTQEIREAIVKEEFALERQLHGLEKIEGIAGRQLEEAQHKVGHCDLLEYSIKAGDIAVVKDWDKDRLLIEFPKKGITKWFTQNQIKDDALDKEMQYIPTEFLEDIYDFDVPLTAKYEIEIINSEEKED